MEQHATLLISSGFCNFCCKPGHKSCYWSIPTGHVQWERGHLPGSIHSYPRCPLHLSGCTWVFARETQTSKLGFSDLMGEGWSIWGNIIHIFILIIQRKIGCYRIFSLLFSFLDNIPVQTGSHPSLDVTPAIYSTDILFPSVFTSSMSFLK